MPKSFASLAAKRAFDIIVSACALLVLSPVLLVAAISVRAVMGSPVLFSQPRPGLGGKPFRLRKFRTMTDERGQDGDLLPDAQRIPPLGAFMRRTSLDELPTLWNVLAGDMSLVGPRPLLVRYLPLYSPEQARRHEVRPGVTGWAQINGRNTISWEAKFKLDVWYVDNRSFWLDLKICALTVLKVLRRNDISHEGHATMPEFTGERSAE